MIPARAYIATFADESHHLSARRCYVDVTICSVSYTDVAVLRAAASVGLGDAIRAPRQRIARFDQSRPFHAAVADGRLHVKGAPESIAGRCSAVRVAALDEALDDAQRQALLEKAEQLARSGYRVLLVAEGDPGQSPEDPRQLVAIGLLGIHDPLRRTVRSAVARCHAAGVRVIMLTGDHPETARRVAFEAGLLDGGSVLTGAAMATLPDTELDDVLENVTVIARATPLDKVRIIESLRRRGHTIAMTGDGVNDAAALRLADVGVAMGRGGTEVARQAADVIVRDDDFSSLVEALVEGRSFWRNLRRSIGLLLGGNLGELTYMVAGSILGLGGALTVRQILATNLITDALPAFAVAVQEPEHRRLDGLEREGTASLGKPLRDEILRRTIATAVPALGAYLAVAATGPANARSVGFATIVSSQLALTVQSGRAQGSLTRPVIVGVGVSAAALLALLTVPPLRTLFELTMPTPLGWVAIGSATAAALVLGAAPYRVPILPVGRQFNVALRHALLPVS